VRARRLIVVAVILIVVGGAGAAAATALNDADHAADASSQFNRPPASMTPLQADAIPTRTGSYP